MGQKWTWRSREPQLLLIAYVVILVLFGSAVAFVPDYSEFQPDEARIVIALRDLGTGWFQEPSWVLHTHLLAQVDYYLLAQVVTVTVSVLKVVGAIFTILTVIYLAWLVDAYALIGRVALLILLVLLATNVSVHVLGAWGVFDYAQRMLISVFLLHALLFLQKTRMRPPPHSLWRLALGFCFVTAGYAANALPIVVLVVVAGLCRPRGGQRDAVPLRTAVVNAVVLLIPVVVAAVIVLAFFAHPEVRSPRPEILWMYFPSSDQPQTASGLLTFFYERTGAFLHSTFDVVWSEARWASSPDPFHAKAGIVIAFGIGLIRSLFESKRNPVRFITGVYVGLVMMSQLVLSGVGVYPFGTIRYALFLHGPLLVVAALGITDVGRWVYAAGVAVVRRFFPPFVAALARGVSVATVIVLALVASFLEADNIRTSKSDFSREFGAFVQSIDADRSPLVIYDAFAKFNLDALGIDFSSRRTFLFDIDFLLERRPELSPADLDEYQALLSTGQDILWITYHDPSTDPLFSGFLKELDATHVRADERRLDFWHVVRWEGGAATGATARFPEGGAGPADALPVLTLAEAMTLLSAYGAALELTQRYPGTVIDASRLPASKARLKSALLTYLNQANDPEADERLKGAYLLIAYFQTGVGDSPLEVDLLASDGRPWREVIAGEQEALLAELASAGR